jgi:hypothetical protein
LSGGGVVIASWSRCWEKRHYEQNVRPVGDCKVTFHRIAVASPQWENGHKNEEVVNYMKEGWSLLYMQIANTTPTRVGPETITGLGCVTNFMVQNLL